MGEVTVPAGVDEWAVRRSFDKAASVYDEHAILQQEVAVRLLKRLDWLRVIPQVMLDIGAGTGAPTAALMSYFPEADMLALDVSIGMLQRVKKKRWIRHRPKIICGDSQQLPIASQSVDLVFSNLSFQWCSCLDTVFREVRRVLKSDGVLLFSTLGPDTLKELRASWVGVDAYPHVHNFLDMHEVGDMVVYAGLQEPVMERDEIVMTYEDVQGVIRDLKCIGALNAMQGRSRGLMGKKRYSRFHAAYEQWRQADGRLPATYEVIYGTAWSGETGRDGVATIAIEEIGRKQGW